MDNLENMEGLVQDVDSSGFFQDLDNQTETELEDNYLDAELDLQFAYDQGDDAQIDHATRVFTSAAQKLKSYRSRKVAYGEQPTTPSAYPATDRQDERKQELYNRANEEYGSSMDPGAIGEAVNKAEAMAAEQPIVDDEEMYEHVRFYLGDQDPNAQRFAYKVTRNLREPLKGVDGSKVSRSKENPNRFFDEAGREYQIRLVSTTDQDYDLGYYKDDHDHERDTRHDSPPFTTNEDEFTDRDKIDEWLINEQTPNMGGGWIGSAPDKQKAQMMADEHKKNNPDFRYNVTPKTWEDE